MMCFDLSNGYHECEGFVHSKADGSPEQFISMSLILIRVDHGERLIWSGQVKMEIKYLYLVGLPNRRTKAGRVTSPLTRRQAGTYLELEYL